MQNNAKKKVMLKRVAKEKKKTDEAQLLRLSARENGELIGEGLITIGILCLIYIAMSVLLEQFLNIPVIIYEQSQTIRELWRIRPASIPFFQTLFTTIFVIFSILFTYWRLIRRYHQMQLAHVLSELHRIAEADHFTPIPFKLNGDMGKVVASINHLVDETNSAMEEERRIEKSKDELITNVSHDIRTPLTSVIGYLGLVVSQEFENPDEPKRYAKIAYNKAQQMKALVDDLFEYTTLRPDGVPLRLVPIQLNNFLAQIAAEFELDAQKKNMSIELVAPDEQVTLEIDAEKMVRVLNNLLSNAIKYGDPETAITISLEENEDVVYINVSNLAPTLEPDAVAKLFNRFYRVEESRSKETGGTGLGLAIAENIVRMHGGVIYAESKNHQTVFHICLPSDDHEALTTQNTKNENFN